MEKFPSELVQLAAMLVPATSEGSNPPMTCPKVESVGVTSTMVIRVASPKPVISLKPSRRGVVVVTSGVPSAARPEIAAGSSRVAGKQYRRQVDGKRALAIGRCHQEIWVRQSTSGSVGRYGPARLGMPVLASMLPDRKAERRDVDMRQIAPFHRRRNVVSGKRVHVGPLSSDWYTPELAPDEQRRVEPCAGGVVRAVGDRVLPVGHDRGQGGAGYRVIAFGSVVGS